MIDSTPLTINDENLPDEVMAKLDAIYREAHEAAKDHLGAIYEHEELLDRAGTDIEDISKLPDNPAVAPWCGCDDCWIREVGHALEPYLEKATLIRWGLRPYSSE